MAALGCGFALACPAFPTNARTVYLGYLFAGGSLLNESGMENHPLTPMTDANLVRVLSRQTEGTVGLVPFATVDQGAHAIRDAMTQLKERGRRYAIVDAITDAHLVSIGEAAASHALITGGSGVAMGLPANFRRRRPAAGGNRSRRAADDRRSVARSSPDHARARRWRSLVTRAPICRCSNSMPWRRPDAAALSEAALAWAADKIGDKPVVIAASAPPEKVAALQARLGREPGRRADRGRRRAHRRRPGRTRRAQDGRGGRRDVWRGRRAAWRASPAHRRRDRSRRALDAGVGAAAPT